MARQQDEDEFWGHPASAFSPHKTYLDPVHFDISVNALEHGIIGTKTFQRLRAVKQLGTAELVFHGAKHDRFAHSLGTLHVAELMVQFINSRQRLKNEGQAIPPRAHRLIRLAALLHDVGHAPYGHQLEDDFPVIPKHDRPERYRALLGPDSEIGRLLNPTVGRDRQPTLGDELIKLLKAKDDGEINGLPYPYAADIVGNTVCADLLDYTRRDVMFTGLDKRSGWRMLKYLFIPVDAPARGRLVVDAWKGDHLRGDVVSDILDLLDVRFALSERVIFHHAKMASGAMLARAVHDSSIDRSDVPSMRDEELLLRLRDDPHPRVQELVRGVMDRDFYKPVWLSDAASTTESTRGYLTEQRLQRCALNLGSERELR